MSRAPASHVIGALRVQEPICGRTGRRRARTAGRLAARYGRTYIAEEFRKLTSLAAVPRPAEENCDQPAG